MKTSITIPFETYFAIGRQVLRYHLRHILQQEEIIIEAELTRGSDMKRHHLRYIL